MMQHKKFGREMSPVRVLSAVIFAAVLALSGCSSTSGNDLPFNPYDRGDHGDPGAESPQNNGEVYDAELGHEVDEPSGLEPGSGGHDGNNGNGDDDWESEYPGPGGDYVEPVVVGSATLTHPSASYTFELLEHCLIGSEDMIAHGWGADDASGESAYLHINFYKFDSLSGGSLQVDQGTIHRWNYTEEFLSMKVGPDKHSTVTISGQSMTARAPVVNEKGESLGEGIVQATCD